jgi:vacuolar-type H+-ATPase subunit H
MKALLNYLDDIEDILDNSKTVPFSNKISVEKERIFDVIGEIRLHLPHEIHQAQRIIDDHDKIVNDAKNRAKDIIRDAEEDSKVFVNEHEIVRRANDEADVILEEARRDARDMRLNAMDYADEMLKKTEDIIQEAMENMELQYKMMLDYFRQTIDVLYENRQQLRGGRS